MTRIQISEERTENKIKKLLMALAALLAVAFFCCAVIGDVFGGTIWDKGVYALAAVLFLVITFSLIQQTAFCRILSDSKTEDFRIDAVQICCFAFVCLMTLYYYNSASNYGHIAATKLMDSAFGIALLCMYRREELRGRWVEYAQAAAVAYYAIDMVSKDRDGKLMVLFVLEALVAWVYIRLIGCLFKRIKRKEKRLVYSGTAYQSFKFHLLNQSSILW